MCHQKQNAQDKFLLTVSVLCMICTMFEFCTAVHSNEIRYAITGNSKLLSCPYQSTSSAVSWTGPLRFVYSINDAMSGRLSRNRRISVIGNKMKGQYNLFIKSLTLDDFGHYQCDTVVNGTTAVHDILLRPAGKPNLTDDFTNLKHRAEIDKPTDILISIRSYEIPVVSWTTNPGGKTGIWLVKQISRDMYQAVSTIIPTSELHYGSYGIRVRNSIGQLNTHVEIVESGFVNMFPQMAKCTIISHVSLICTMKARKYTKLENEWTHVRNGIVLRSLNGIVYDRTSNLSISYCDQRDAGEYICQWSAGDKVYSNQSTVMVEGQPVFVQATIREERYSIHVEVEFFSVPEPGEITWFYKDVIVGTKVTSQSVIGKIINITLYEKKVPVNGYTARISAKHDHFPRTELLNCQLQNIYGVLDISFADITFSNSAIFDGIYVRTGTLDGNIVNNKIERGNSSKNSVKETQSFKIYLCLGGIAALFMLLFMAALIININMKRRKVYSAALAAEQSHDTRLNSSNVQLPNQDYEDIDSVYYHSVEWRDYNLDPQFASELTLEDGVQEHYENEAHDGIEINRTSSDCSDYNFETQSLQTNGNVIYENEVHVEMQCYEDLRVTEERKSNAYNVMNFDVESSPKIEPYMN